MVSSETLRARSVPWSVLRFVLQEDWRDLQTNVRDFGPAWAGRPAVFAQGDLTQNWAGNWGVH